MADLPKKLVDVATLSRRLIRHDDDAHDHPEEKLKEIHDDWRVFRKWRKAYGAHGGPFHPQVALPAPLIADGMVRVTLDPSGQETVALVHALKTADHVREEQWVIFDAAVDNFKFTFNVGGTNQPLTVTTVKAPARLPWPKADHPDPPPPVTYWWPVANGDSVTPDDFFKGVQAALTPPGGPAFRYVWATVKTSDLTAASPPTPAEHKPGLKSGRGWEESLALTPSAPDTAKEWVYGEWEQDPQGDPSYTPVTIHMAWRLYGPNIPPNDVAVGTAFEPANRRDLKDWFRDTRTRLGIALGTSGTYAVGNARLYASADFLNLQAKPTP